MKFFYYLSLILALSSCGDTTPTKVSINQIFDCEDQGFVDVRKWRNEVLAIDSMKINNVLPVISTIKAFKEEFGEPISSYNVAEEDISLYGNDPNSKNRYVFKNLIVDQSNDQVILNTINFRNSGIIITHPKINLQEGTSVIQVCELFPRSCRLIPSNGNQWSGFIELKASPSGVDFRRVFLIFQRERLVKLKITNFNIM